MSIIITVTTEKEKQELLEASKHIHDLRNVNTNLEGVNFLCHIYLAPDLITVSNQEGE